MRLLKKIAYACCSVTFGLLTLIGCTDGELYDVNAPDWISDKIQEIEDSKKQPEDEVLEGMLEDVYTFGKTMQLGGSWVGAVGPEDLPVEMEVDWVHFYQRKSKK